MSRCSVTGKVMHRTREAACVALHKVNICTLNVFQCRHCDAWHRGSSRNQFRQQQRIDQILSEHERGLRERLSRGSDA